MNDLAGSSKHSEIVPESIVLRGIGRDRPVRRLAWHALRTQFFFNDQKVTNNANTNFDNKIRTLSFGGLIFV